VNDIETGPVEPISGFPAKFAKAGTDVDVNDRIKDQIDTNPVLLYMKGTPDFPQCGFSGQTVAALKAIGKPFAFVNIFEDPEIREGLKAYSNWPTFPQLYVNGELVGGCDIVVEMFHSGELKALLDPDATPSADA
jgi:monothiol glutaredoxin